MTFRKLAVKALILIALLLATFAVVTLWMASRAETRAEAAFPPLGEFVDVDGVRVHALVMGSGPDLVLIHGSSGNVRDLSFELAGKLATDYRVIIFDRPGLGYTDSFKPEGESIVDQARVLSAAAAKLGATQPIVAGQSYGGAVALAWAVHFPDRISALVPIAAASNPWTTPLDPLYQITSHPILGPIVIPMITAYVTRDRVERSLVAVFEPQAVPTGYADHFGPGLTLRRGSLRANAKHRANLLGEIQALHTRYGEIAVPTEIIHGTADTTVGIHIHSEPLSRQIPGAVLTPMPGIGHMPQHVAHDAVIAAIHRAAARAGLR